MKDEREDENYKFLLCVILSISFIKYQMKKKRNERKSELKMKWIDEKMKTGSELVFK